MKIQLKHNVSGAFKDVKIGFSWTSLCFGPIVPLFRGDVLWTLLWIIVTPITLFIFWPIFPFIYNKIYIKKLLETGYIPANEVSANELMRQGWISSVAPKSEKNSINRSEDKNDNRFSQMNLSTTTASLSKVDNSSKDNADLDSNVETNIRGNLRSTINKSENADLVNLVDYISKNHQQIKKSYIGQNIDSNVLAKIKNKVKTFNSNSEEIYYTCTGGVFSFVTYFLVLTNKNLHCRLANGYIGLTKSLSIPLATIKSIEIKSTWTKPVYGGGMYGPEVHVNGKLIGWMTHVSDVDEKLLLELFAEINNTGVLL